MDTYRAQIRSALEAVQIETLTGFLWFGTQYELSLQEANTSLSEEQQVSFLSLSLQNHLYQHFYCSGGASHHAVSWDPGANGADNGRFIARLSEANSGKGFWDPGWQICALHSSAIGLMKDGLTVYVPSEDSLVHRGRPLTTGATASLRHLKESFNRSPGFYTVYGDEPLGATTTGGLLRLYWNVGSTGADEFVRAVTRRLNGARIPFNLKVLDDPARYTRCDSAVLYIDKESYTEFNTDHAKHILGCIADHLTSSVPALTKQIAAGVSVAENPTRQESFGSDRCNVLAKAMIATFFEQGMSVNEKLDLVEDRFRQSEIDPEKPYLQAGSSDDYEPIELGTVNKTLSQVSAHDARALSDERFLVAASEIGALIARKAVWHKDQCNWVGALGPVSEASPVQRFGSLGTNLYDGTSGIALFLGQLCSITGDQRVRQTALGAIRHALAHCKNYSRKQFGLYVGILGTAVVAARLGMLLHREDLLRQGQSLAKTSPPEETGFDLMSGAAGKILAYITLYEIFGDEFFLKAACSMGKRLVASADSSELGVSWSSAHTPERRNLTGFSHGTAGAASSLLELFALSGDHDFRSTAEAAFDYERSWFDARERNWPDFRQLAQSASKQSIRFPFSNTWCHGAPGIAVSRVRAAEIIPDQRYLGEALVALETTRDHLRTWLRSGRANYSLCHGVAGNADVLLTAVQSGAQFVFDPEDLIRETAELGLQAYGGKDSLWPCGVGGGGANPSLMLGWAGIGYFYLRLACEDIPSPLAPGGKISL